VAPLDGVAPLKMLSLNSVNCTSLPRHSLSLTKLKLQNVFLEGIISGPLAFPSLTFLSLFNATGLKPHIDAPCLATYHEGGNSTREPFSAPLQSLVEYGVYHHNDDDLDPNGWNYYFPNISRLSIWATSNRLALTVNTLFGYNHLLPALEKVTVKSLGRELAERDLKSMRRQLRERNEACHTGVVLQIKPGEPRHILLFFAMVSRTLLDCLRFSDAHIVPRTSSVKVIESQVCLCSPNRDPSRILKRVFFPRLS